MIFKIICGVTILFLGYEISESNGNIADCTDNAKKFNAVLKDRKVVIDWSNVDTSITDLLLISYREVNSRQVTYTNAETSNTTSIILPGESLELDSEILYGINLSVSTYCNWFYYVATGENALPNCPTGLYDMIIKVKDEAYDSKFWTEDHPILSEDGILNPGSQKSTHFSETSYDKFCFGMTKDTLESAKWMVVSPQSQRSKSKSRLKTLVGSIHDIEEDIHSIKNLLAGQSQTASEDHNLKGFNIGIDSDGSPQLIRFGAKWKISSKTWGHFGIGHEQKGKHGRTSGTDLPPKVGFAEIMNDGNVLRSSVEAYTGLFFGIRAVKDYTRPDFNVAKSNCGDFSLGTCGTGFYEGQCSVKGVHAEFFCPDILKCVLECKLTPPDIILKEANTTSISIKWSQFNVSSMQEEGNFIGYQLEHKLSNEKLWGNPLVTTQLDHTYSSLSSNTSYLFRLMIQAKNAKVADSYSFINISTLSSPPLSALSDWEAEEQERKFCVLLETSDSITEHCTTYPLFTNVLTGLSPYTEYNVSVYCINGIGDGPKDGERKTVMTDELAPDVPPSDRRASQIQTNHFRFSWNKPPSDQIYGVIRSYNISIVANNATEVDLIAPVARRRRSVDSFLYLGPLKLWWNTTVGGNITSIFVDNLFGNVEYSVFVSSNTKYLGVYSPELQVTTHREVPLISAWDVQCRDATTTSVYLTWKKSPQLLLQGELTQYTLYVRKSDGEHEKTENHTKESTNAWTYKLKPYSSYMISLSGWTAYGEGNRTPEIVCETMESVPDRPPENVSSATSNFPNATTITWSPILKKHWNGNLLGYVIYYKMLAQGENYVNEPWKEVLTRSLDTTYLLKNLSVYSRYKVHLAGYTKIGVGPKSVESVFDTCRVDSGEITINYKPYEAFVSNSNSSYPSGIMVEPIKQGILRCAQQCISFNQSVHISFKELTNISTLDEATRIMDGTTGVMIPSNVQEESFASKYVVVVNIPGFLLLKSPDNVDYSMEKRELEFMGQVMKTLNVVILYIALNVAFGALFTCCEWTHAQNNQHCYSLSGIFDGVYLAIMTSTTVGYGDKIPLTTRGRVYIIMWTLIGLVITGICVGSLASALSVDEITTFRRVYPKAKVIAIIGSPEYHWAKTKMQLEEDKVFKSHREVIEELRLGRYKYGLIDQYSFTVHRQNITRNGILIAKQYKSKESQLGALLGGSNTHLLKCMQRFQKDNKDIVENAVKQLKENKREANPSDKGPSLVKKETIALISVESPILRKILVYLTITYICFCLCGGIFTMYKSKKLQHDANKVRTTIDKLHAKMSKIQEFSNDYKCEMDTMMNRLTAQSDECCSGTAKNFWP